MAVVGDVEPLLCLLLDVGVRFKFGGWCLNWLRASV